MGRGSPKGGADNPVLSADINLSNRNKGMKTIVALALAMVLLLGCTQQGGSSNTAGTANKNTTAAPAPAPALAGNATITSAPTESTTGVMMADYKFPELPKYDFSNATTPNGTLIVYYFHSSKCSACQALQPEIESLKARYPDVMWLDYDITTQNGRYAYNAFAAQRNLSPKEELVPQALVDEIGRASCRERVSPSV
jgi:thiol-disulfide isomerase/thioredoxin